MLSKKILLATVFTLCLGSQAWASTAWQNLKVDNLIDSGTYLTDKRWRISPLGIEFKSQNACYQSKLDWFLNQHLVNQKLKVKFETEYSPRQLHRQGHVKFDSTKLLGEFLLTQGWAKISNQPHLYTKEYHAAQKEAQNAKRGLWGECDAWHELRERQRIAGKTVYTPASYKPHLQASSSSWVKEVLSPTILLLHDGTKLKLQGLKMVSDDSEIARCWNTQTLNMMQQHLVGRPIIIQPDQLQLSPQGKNLQRYVWLPSDRYQSSKLLNAELISQGWAQLKADELNLKNVDLMQQAETDRLSAKSAPSWWKSCMQTVLDKPITETVEPKILAYDEECPIKGNIAGSKKNPKRTYHTPASGWYKRIEHEACFADEAEAEAAGFVKVK